MIRKSFRVLITEKCNAKCNNCFNKDIRIDNELTTVDFLTLSIFLKENGIEQLKIMGGEPTTHSSFEEIVDIAQQNFKSVIIFTNGINENIKKIKLRESDYITYNFNFINEKFDLEKIYIFDNAKISFEIQISSLNNIKLLEQKIAYISNRCKHLSNISYNLTLDCMEDIFKNKDFIIHNWNKLISFLEINNLIDLCNIDHRIPYCLYKNLLQLKNSNSQCDLLCAGLIDSSGYLHFCNQSHKKLLKILSDGQIICQYSQIDGLLNYFFNDKLEKNRSGRCLNCKYFLKVCNGGCFVHKLID